jgi:hypothetical protein
MAVPVFLYGIGVSLIPAMCANIAADRCALPPSAVITWLSAPGFAFATAMNSLTVPAGTEALIASTEGKLAMNETGAKSFTAS